VDPKVSRRGITIATRKPVGDTPLARHQKFVDQVHAAGRSIEIGACPNDGALMVNGACPAMGCTFRYLIGEPAVVDLRVTFHRRASKRFVADAERFL
jgi:hypothetical protein